MAWRSVAGACGLLLASSAAVRGQSPPPSPPAKEVAVGQRAAGDDSRLRIDLGDTSPRVPGTFTFGGMTIDGRFQPDTARAGGGFGPTWQTTAAARYRAPGGVDVSAAIVARRGYELPLFMTTPAGADSPIATSSQAYVTTARVPVLFDTRLRVQRRVFARDGLNVDLVAEALNLVNANVSREAGEISSTLTSRTFRFGLVLGF